MEYEKMDFALPLAKNWSEKLVKKIALQKGPGIND